MEQIVRTFVIRLRQGLNIDVFSNFGWRCAILVQSKYRWKVTFDLAPGQVFLMQLFEAIYSFISILRNIVQQYFNVLFPFSMKIQIKFNGFDEL